MVDTHYRAFVSYSHRDREVGEKLHRKLESYHVPSRLVGKLTKDGSVPRRLTPIFRDREDFPTSGNLSASVEDALRRSRFLIVLCSPSAAASEWVDREIGRFKSLHGEDRILGVIVDSEENVGVKEPEKLFPPSLRFHVDADGRLTDQPVEPLAADLRESGDGFRYGLLKIVAGLIDVGLDDLVHRDHGRRNRNMQIATAGLATVSLALAGLTWLAIDARNEAQSQRNAAEGLVEFMLTDLKGKLEEHGRIDLLDSTGKRLLEYYAVQNPNKLDADSLGRRARAQILVGDIDQRRNDLDSALEAYEAAAATTGVLLKREPGNPDRIFEHAQSVFWVGYVAHQRRNMDVASTKLNEYLELAKSLVDKDADNPKWRMEYAYALGNLGAVEHSKNQWPEAISYFEQSADAWRRLKQDYPDKDQYVREYAYMLSWIVNARMQQGRFADAEDAVSEQLSLYREILDNRPNDIQAIDPMAVAMRRLSETRLALGRTDSAHEAALEAKRLSDRLIEHDKENAFWRIDAARTETLHADLYHIDGDRDEEIMAAARAVDLARSVVAMDDTESSTLNALGRALARRVAASGDAAASADAARELQKLYDETRPVAMPDLYIVSEGALALSEYYNSRGDAARASVVRKNALELLSNADNELPALVRFAAYRLCALDDDDAQCALFAEPLQNEGFGHPLFAELQKNREE